MKRPLVATMVACACAHGEAPRSARPVTAMEAPRAVEQDPALLLDEAHELMARKRWDSAKERLDAFLARVPRSAGALFDAGFVAEQRGARDEARELYRRALEVDPGQVGSAINLVRLQPRKPADDEQILRRALARREDPALLAALASVLAAEGKIDDAESAARKVLARHPDDVSAQKSLAAIEAARGHPRMAESLLLSARKLDGRDPAIPHALGVLAAQRDDVSAARALFEQATALEPAFAPAWINLGALALRYRDYPAAEQAYARAIQLEERWESRLGHGWALEGLKRPREARAEFEKVLELQPGQDDAAYGRALALKADGDLPAALQAFREYVAHGKAAHLKEAQGQIAALDLRLKTSSAKAAVKPAAAGKDPRSQPSATEPSAGPAPLERQVPPESAPKARAEQGKDGGVAAAR